jgi:hypothetical protein
MLGLNVVSFESKNKNKSGERWAEREAKVSSVKGKRDSG